MPILVVSSDDGLREADEAYAAAVKAAGRAPRVIHFTTDHSCSDHRTALQAEGVEWLADLDGPSASTR